MQFKDWIKEKELMEMSDIQNMPTDSVQLEPIEFDDDDFDEKEAEKDCERELRHHDFSHDVEIYYDDPHEDPDFDIESPEHWEEENPEPDPEEYENNTEDEDYIKDLAKWKEEKTKHEKEYDHRRQEWEASMYERKSEAEDIENENKYKAVQDCIEKKRVEYKEENKDAGFKSKFKHQNTDFEVTMSKTKIEYAGRNIPGSYNIDFAGPNGYRTTNTAGTSGSAIYTQVLLAIKKLMTTQEVNGISFYPAEPGMALVYQRFFDRFLSNDFMRISKNEAVRKTTIEQINQKLRITDKLKAQEKIDKENQETNDYFNLVKANRSQERLMKKLIPTMLYKIVKTKDNRNIAIFDMRLNTKGQIVIQGIVSGYSLGDYAQPIKLTTDDITQTPTDIESGKRLLTTIKNNSNWLSLLDQNQFNAMAKQYGVDMTGTSQTASWQHI